MAEIAGLQLIVPSSVSGTGVSVSATGKITLSSATSWSVNGCFSALYTNYVLVCNANASTPHAPAMYMRAAGTDSTTSSYLWQELASSGATLTGGRGGGYYTSMYFSYTSSNYFGLHNFIYGPYIAAPTSGRVVPVLNYSSPSNYELAWKHTANTAYDGFSVVSSGGASLSGDVYVYGMNE